MWSDVCRLGVLKPTENDIGDVVNSIEYGEDIFCNEKSVKYSEFYQAQALGIKPELVLEIKQVDYNKEKYVIYDNTEYTVLRIYKTSTEDIELTLTRGVEDECS